MPLVFSQDWLSTTPLKTSPVLLGLWERWKRWAKRVIHFNSHHPRLIKATLNEALCSPLANMGVSKNGVVPPNPNFSGISPYKPSIFGYLQISPWFIHVPYEKMAIGCAKKHRRLSTSNLGGAASSCFPRLCPSAAGKASGLEALEESLMFGGEIHGKSTVSRRFSLNKASDYVELVKLDERWEGWVPWWACWRGVTMEMQKKHFQQ